MERDWSTTSFGKEGGRVCSEGVEKLLEGVGEDDLVVLPGVHGSELGGDFGGWGYLRVCTGCRPWM